MLFGLWQLALQLVKGFSSANAMSFQIGVATLAVQGVLGVFFLLSSLALFINLHKLYPYYYCQMLKGIYDSDFALLLSGEDIQREMDQAWRERFLGMPLRGKLVSLEQHLYSSALIFEAIFLYSRHKKWLGSMGRYRSPRRQVNIEVLYRWSWATGLILLLLVCTFGVFLVHVAIVYTAAAPQHLIASARLAALIDNYFDAPAVDPSTLPELPRDNKYFRRLAAPLRTTLPKVRY